VTVASKAEKSEILKKAKGKRFKTYHNKSYAKTQKDKDLHDLT